MLQTITWHKTASPIGSRLLSKTGDIPVNVVPASDARRKTRVLQHPQVRGLSRTESSSYVGVSPSYWDDLVDQGIMPKPLRLGLGRVIFDVDEIDAAIERLKSRDDTPAREAANEWDSVLQG